MGLIASLIEKRQSIERPTTPINQETLAGILTGPPAASGKRVSPSTALQLSAVYACVRVISETIATLPLHVYSRLEQGKERAVNHPLYQILHAMPNPEMSSVELREAMMGHVLLWGNAYAEVIRSGAGRVRELWPLRPDRVRVMRNARNELIYEVTRSDGTTMRKGADRVLHIRGFGFDGLKGYSPITLARESIGLGMAAEEYAARFFSNDSRPGGVLKSARTLSPKAAENLKQSWESAHGGLDNRHRVAILEEGIEWQQIGIPPRDAQFLELRQFQVTEIARIFRVPPHLIGDLDRATFSNIEHQSIEFVVHTIRPWLVRWEQAISRTLFSSIERKSYFAEFLVDGLLRGDIKSRYDAYAVARQNGWLNGDEIRELENMNPFEGGDKYLVNGNMLPIDKVGQDPEPASAPEPEPGEDGDAATETAE